MRQIELASLIYYRDRDRQYVDKIVSLCRDVGIDVRICELDPRPDVVIVLGGDGSILQYVHDEAFSRDDIFNIPILHVGTGKVNFFADITVDELSREVFEDLRNGRFSIDERSLICTYMNNDRILTLNEVVMRYVNPGKIVEFYVTEPSGEVVLQGRMDGVIVATPTGSTAYLLALGGPVVDYRIQTVKIVIPVAPFSPALVPIVHPIDVRVIIESRGDCMIVCDGILYGRAQRIIVDRADRSVRFVRTRSYRFYDRLRRRLFTP